MASMCSQLVLLNGQEADSLSSKFIFIDSLQYTLRKYEVFFFFGVCFKNGDLLPVLILRYYLNGPKKQHLRRFTIFCTGIQKLCKCVFEQTWFALLNLQRLGRRSATEFIFREETPCSIWSPLLSFSFL